MTQYTWNSGRGVPGPYNDSDFTTSPSGPASGQWTWNRGLGFPGPWNDSDFTTSPGTPGGDVTAVSSSLSAIIVGGIAEIDGFDIVIEAYGSIEGDIGVPAFSVERLDVDIIDFDMGETYIIEFTWV